MTPAFADEPLYTAKHIPACKVYKTIGGAEICGYTLDEWTDVLRVDARITKLDNDLKKESSRSVELAKQVSLLHGQVDVFGSNTKLLVDRNEKLVGDLIELDRKYQDERVKPRWGSPLAWTIAAVSTSILAGVVVGKLID